MYLCIAYDISTQRTRTRAAKFCKKIGMMRLQKSLFIGNVQERHKNDLEAAIIPLLAPTDKWSVIPLNREIWVQLVQTGRDTQLLTLLNKVNVWSL